MAIKVGDAILFVSLEKKAFDKQISSLTGQVKKMGSNIGSIAKQLTVLGGAAAVGLGFIIKEASGFESAFAGVRKTLDLTEDQFAELRSELLNMSKSIPVTADELAGIAEIAGQMGVKGVENVKRFTRTIADLGVSTDLSFEQGAKQLSRFINVTRGVTSDIENIGSSIVDLGNKFATSESEITSMALRLAGTGEIVGLTQAQILGVAAAASSLGIEAEAGGTAISRLLRMMEEGGGKAERFGNLIGVTGDEFTKLFKANPAKVFEDVLSSMGMVNQEGGDLNAVFRDLGIQQVRLVDIMSKLALGSGVLSDAINFSTIAYGENIALTEEAEKRYATFASQIQMVFNRIRVLAIEVGTPFLEPLKDFIKTELIPELERMSSWIFDNEEQIRSWAIEILAIVVPSLKSLWKWVFNVGFEIANWIKENPKLTWNIFLWAGAITVASIALGILAPAIGLVTGGIRLLSTAIKGILGLNVLGWTAGLIGSLGGGAAVAGGLGAGSSLGLAGIGAGVAGVGFLGVASAAFMVAAGITAIVLAWQKLPSIGELKDIFAGVEDPTAPDARNQIFSGPMGAFGVQQTTFGPRQFASGGIAPGGLALVGERGPELVNLPRGSQVFSNEQSRGMGSTTININISGARFDSEESLVTKIKKEILQAIDDNQFNQGALA